MTSRRRAVHRKDRNHAAIVAVAEAYGWQVVDLSGAGAGIPDLLAYKASAGWRLIEVKAGKGQTFTEAQQRFRARYTLPVLTITSEFEAEQVFNR